MTNRVIPTVATIAVAVFALAACSKSTNATPAATVTVTTTVTASPAPVAASVVAAASSGGSAPASLAAAPDPCALLTKSEADTLAGTKLQAATDAGSGGVKTLCQYTGDPSGPTAQVEVIVGDGAKKALDIDRDHYLTAEEAREYGLIDDIIQPRRGVAAPTLQAAIA